MSQIVRPPAVAGLFYPADRRALAGEVDALLAGASAATSPGALKALIVPHAGYVYSGPIAANAYQLLRAQRATIRRVVLLGPAHRVLLRGLALPEAQAMQTPLGDVTIDPTLVAAIRDLPQVTMSAAAHAAEHSLEVQLPFLQRVLDEFTLLPLVVGEATADEIAKVLERVWGGPETLIVISSDLSHYLPYDTSRRFDRNTCRHITQLEPLTSHEQACGATPVNGLIVAARHHGLAPQLLDLRNSGDTAGDRSRVVGYAAFAFTEPRHEH
jgi:hypothetical protein